MLKGTFLLLFSVGCAAYEYKAISADRTWMGTSQGLRYIDHIKLLSTKLKKTEGFVTSMYKFSANKEWDAVFDLNFSGDRSTEKDLFGFALTKSILTIDDWSYISSNFEGFKAASAGMYALGSQNQLKFTLKDQTRISGDSTAPKSCGNLPEALHLRLHSKDGQIKLFVSDAKNHNAALTECGSMEFTKKPLTQFYLSFWARSGKSAWQVDVKNLLLETDAENTGIETYFSHHDRSLPRLFRRINLLSSQHGSLPVRTVDTALNVSQVYNLESTCHAKLEVINHLLSANLEQSDELISYLQRQKRTASEFNDSLLKSLANWINNTSEQYSLMAENSEELTEKLNGYNFRGAYAKTKKLVDELERLLDEKNGVLGGLFNLARTYKQNFSLLTVAKKSLAKTPKLLLDLQNRIAGRGDSGHSVALLSGLSFLGVVVLGFLLSIHRRLKRAQQKKLFE